MHRFITALLLCTLLVGFQTNAGQKPGKKEAPAKTAPAPAKGATKKELPPAPPSDKSADPVVGKTAAGKPVYEGSRGGFYYLTDGGNKSYVQDFVGAKIVGKTADGKNIYEGPKGGRFYYNDKGDKVYQKKK